MTEQIEAAMQQEIEALDWMSPATKTGGAAQAARHPQQDRLPRPVARLHQRSTVKPDDYFGNVAPLHQFEDAREWHKLGKPVDLQRVGHDAAHRQRLLQSADERHQLSRRRAAAAALRRKLDDAPNYGNTGATIGHELTHAFDDEGRQFDAKGNLRDWWTPADAKGFEDRINCVRDQYAGYVVVDDIHINSKLTSGEDVADLGGTLLAYIAWKKQTAGQTLASLRTASRRTSASLSAWRSGPARTSGRRTCGSAPLTDPHSPGFARINGVVSNMPEFQQAFGCKAGQPMVHAPDLQGLVSEFASITAPQHAA